MQTISRSSVCSSSSHTWSRSSIGASDSTFSSHPTGSSSYATTRRRDSWRHCVQFSPGRIWKPPWHQGSQPVMHWREPCHCSSPQAAAGLLGPTDANSRRQVVERPRLRCQTPLLTVCVWQEQRCFLQTLLGLISTSASTST